MNHKRGRAKNRRAGCLLCKSWKVNGAKNAVRHSERRRIVIEEPLMSEDIQWATSRR